MKVDNPNFPKDVKKIKAIGKGSSSSVYSCYVDGYICAMKEVEQEEAKSELETLQHIPKHPNLVRYLSHRYSQGTLQLFLQQYSGTLQEIIDERKQSNNAFSTLEILEILLDISKGLRALHRKKIIHRGISIHFKNFIKFLYSNYYFYRFESREYIY